MKKEKPRQALAGFFPFRAFKREGDLRAKVLSMRKESRAGGVFAGCYRVGISSL
jgi:hypothetical protein